MKMFAVNGKMYKSKEFTFGLIRQLESYGLQISQVKEKPMTMLSAYVAICGDMTISKADEEIEAHIISGGNFDEIMEIMTKEMEESRFFQALSKTEDKTPEQVEKKK